MTTATLEDIPEVLADLTAHDRCDRCRAQAYVRVELFTGSELMFCAHDYAKHEAALEPRVLRIRDERARLNVTYSDVKATELA